MAVCDLTKHLMALDWALVCRTHVASLLAQIRSFASNHHSTQDPIHPDAPPGHSKGHHGLRPHGRDSKGEGDKKGGAAAMLKAKVKASMMHFSAKTRRSFTDMRRPPSSAEIERQGRGHLLLLRWCAALIWADRFHVDTELQARSP